MEEEGAIMEVEEATVEVEEATVEEEEDRECVAQDRELAVPGLTLAVQQRPRCVQSGATASAPPTGGADLSVARALEGGRLLTPGLRLATMEATVEIEAVEGNISIVKCGIPHNFCCYGSNSQNIKASILYISLNVTNV